MLDKRIDKLGVYFEYHNVLERYGIGFEQFIYMVDNNTWKDVVSAGN